MTIELTDDEIETILTSLKYSLRAITDAQGTPTDVRRQNIERVEAVATKLRDARRRGEP